MRTKIIAILSFVVLLIAFAPSARADQSRVIRLRDVEGDVTIHPSDSQRPAEASVNTPVLDGDELETQEGRAELAFRNGIVVRVGDDSRVRIASSYSPMRIELQEGTVFVDSHMVDSFRDTLEVLAGDTQIYLVDEGNMRVDLGSEGSVRVTSIHGEAEVRASGRRVLVEDGERTYVDPGSAPEQAEAFNGKTDDLDDWNQSRIEQYADRNDDSDRYLDDDVQYDGSDLDQYGDWQAYGNYGHVWVPRVDEDWRPYNDGRWTYSSGGWFWVSQEPWGWAPYHYGRWGWALNIGWYWIPGDVFAPAWVSWYDYGDYIGWCPLNFYNRPIYAFNFNYYNNNLPRVFKQRTLDAGNSWTFLKKRDLGAPNVKKVLLPPNDVRKIRIDENRVIRAPQSQLVNYVIPKTTVPAYVNDKRIVKSPEDIHNPLGVNHREEQFGGRAREARNEGRGEKKQIDNGGTAVTPKHRDDQFGRGPTPGNSNAAPGRDRDRDSRVRSERDGGNRNPSGDRDNQFSRDNNPRERQNHSYVSPYYRERDLRDRGNDDNREADPTLWLRQRLERQNEADRNGADRNNDDNNRNISPRYGDEARRLFEQFDQNRRDRSEQNSRDSRPQERTDRPESPRQENSRPAPPPPQQHQSHGSNNGSHGGGNNKPDHHH